MFTAYIYIYDNYRVYTLPWDSIWTWLIAALGYDLGYYWVHRAAHGKDFEFSLLQAWSNLQVANTKSPNPTHTKY
jgi:sterol desaturase/sphingolipid hydroxylase (fatty acid hydroxylase superfamily)